MTWDGSRSVMRDGCLGNDHEKEAASTNDMLQKERDR